LNSSLAETGMQHLSRAENEGGMSRSAYARQSLAPPVRVVLWLVFALMALGFSFQWTAGTSVHNDFTQNVWLPSRLVLNGANPYKPTRSQVDAALGDYKSAFEGFNSGSSYHFIYPIWVALVMAPFGAAPLVGATAVWRAANIVLLVWGIGGVLRSTGRTYRSIRPASIAALAVALLLGLVYRESILTVYLGQFAIIEFGLLAAIWGWLLSSGELGPGRRAWGDALVGVALAVLATKPQAVGLAVLLVALWALSRRRWVIPAAAAVGLAALLLVPALFYPWSLGDWFSVAFGGQASSQVQVSASVWGLSYQWLQNSGGTPIWLPVAALLSLAGLLLLVPMWRRDLRDKVSYVPLSLLVTLCINSVISPYMLGYEHVVLLLPALVFLSYAGLPGEHATPEAASSARLWRLGIFTWLGLLPFIVVALQAVLEREYPAILQSASLLVLTLFMGKRYYAQRNFEFKIQSSELEVA
jgi:hypothetical protein